MEPRSKPADPAGLPAPVKGLALVSFFNDVASEMVYPLLPAFVTSTLGAGPLALGALDGAADLTAALLRWWSGRLADRPGLRRPLVLGGYAIAVVVRPVVALASAAWQVIGLRVTDRVGKGLRSPARDAMIADLAASDRHGRAFGIHRAADHAGAVLGSLAAFVLLERSVEVRTVIGWSVLPGLAALLVLVAVLRGAGHAEPRVGEETRPSGTPGGRPDRRLVALAALAAARLPETLLLLTLSERGLALPTIPLLWGLLHVVRSAASYPAGKAADRIGVGRVLGIGAFGYSAGLALLALAGSSTAAVVVFVALGVASGVLEPVERALVASVGGGKRGQAFGTYQSLAGLGSLVVGLGIGWLFQARGGPLALGAAALLSGLALLGWLAAASPPGARLRGA
ncbi:MAG: MFS transporter [Gemmatimonadales bacterium]